MDKNDIIKELRAKLGDSPEENDKILRAEGEKFANEGNTDGINAVGELLLENMPESRRKEIEHLTHLDGLRLDQYHQKIVELLEAKQTVKALPLAEKLYKKITVDYAHTENAKFVSLRNPFEDNLCQVLFKDDRILNRSPFDFSQYITTYAYLLVETGANIDAIPILETAIEYNPVDVAPRFELCEVYKLIRNKKMVIEVTRDTLKIASSPIAIARCYANVGYILTSFADFEDAGVFYTASMMFAPNPAIPMEMKHLSDLKGSPIIRPTQQQIINTMKKYDLDFGPNKQVIETAAQLSSHYLTVKDYPNALNALKITYNLTRDENIKNLILKIDPNSPMLRPQEASNGAASAEEAAANRGNITKN
ncbi:MAG: tetratricopeptide repeat protein [Ruminococcus sp.]|nr:tetratricopeptide repeat protein [Ruminococcus sp.]